MPAAEALPGTGARERGVARSTGAEALLVATDVGVDVVCDADETTALVAALTARGAAPVPEEAVEMLRVEHGRPRYGVDLDDTSIPQEAGLNERAVSFTKGCYVGQETVARLHYKGKPNRHLRGLRLSEPVPAGAELLLGERDVGRLGERRRLPRARPDRRSRSCGARRRRAARCGRRGARRGRRAAVPDAIGIRRPATVVLSTSAPGRV